MLNNCVTFGPTQKMCPSQMGHSSEKGVDENPIKAVVSYQSSGQMSSGDCKSGFFWAAAIVPSSLPIIEYTKNTDINEEVICPYLPIVVPLNFKVIHQYIL